MNCKLLLIVLLGSVGAAHAEDVYKWTDAGGVTHYSDAPPPQGTENVQRVRVSGGASRGMSRETPPPPPETASDAAKDDKPKQQAATMPDTAENRAKLCDHAKSNLELLQSKYQVSYDKSGGGNPEVLDEKARQAQIENAQQQVSIYCKPG